MYKQKKQTVSSDDKTLTLDYKIEINGEGSGWKGMKEMDQK